MIRIKTLLRQAVVVVVLLCLTLLTDATKAAPPDVGTTAGKTYGEWAAGWWQWMFSIPAAENPQDARGAIDCSTHQAGPVWFLAGGDLGKPVSRSCDVPAGTKLFFPVINMLAYNNVGETLTVADKRAMLDNFFGVGEMANKATSSAALPRSCDLTATINGQSIARFTPSARVQTPPFAINTGDGPFDFPPV